MMKKYIYANKLVLIFFAAAVLGFCIITNTSGDYRAYLPEDLPFVIQLNENTPNEFKPVVDQALSVWNNVEGSYFEFQRGGDTGANGVASDGINLLYFDASYENFDPVSNVIAKSFTFTNTIGGFHAYESDYIWNAAAYPPAIDGNPNRIDLWTVTLHEVGHHLGLSHNGDDGNIDGSGSEGCGVNLPSSVMYYAVSFGQIKHDLHIHDEMGAVAIYPNFVIEGEITDAETGEPVENAKLVFSEGTYAAYVGPVEDSQVSNRGLRPGEVYTEAPTLEDGTYLLAVQHEDFSFQVEKFGYEITDVIEVDFDAPSGFGNTQIAEFNFQLEKTTRVNLSGTITNTKTGEAVQPEIVISWVGDENENYNVSPDINGQYTVNLPSNAVYKIELFFNPPFEEYLVIDSVEIGSTNATLDIDVTPSNLMLVYDINNSSFISNYKNSLENLGIGYVDWDPSVYSNAPNEVMLDQFSEPLTMLWVSGGDTTSNITESERLLLENHLSKGNRLIMTGRNIVEFEDSNGTLIPEYAGVRFAGNSSAFSLRGFEGDIIGDGINVLMPGAGKDILVLSDERRGTVDKMVYYGNSDADTNNIAGVRSQNEIEGWKFILFSDGLDKISEEIRDTLLYRSLVYAGSEDFISGININFKNDELPNVYSISQNYPNPFNPSTTIKFALPVNANVKLIIYNILGEQIEVLKDGMMNSGSYELRWDATASSISSGIYFYRIEADGINGSRFAETKKMILLK